MIASLVIKKENKFKIKKRLKKTKNKKTIIGTMLLLLTISGICGIQNISAIDNPDYTKTIPAGVKSYFNFDLYEGDTLKIVFKVIAGGNKDIDFYILNSDGSYVEGFEKHRYIQGTFYLVAPYDDIFSVYFDNSFSLITSKTVEISFDIEYRKSITILSPKSTDTFDNGYNYIEWTTTGDIDYVRIELYYGNSFLEVIKSSTYNDGYYAWYFSSNDVYSEGQYYQIRISDYEDDSIYVFSSSFSIVIEPESTGNSLNNIILFVIIPIAIVIVIGIIILKLPRRTSKKKITIQQKEILKITYCSECGIKITDMTKDYCSQCGSKIIK